MVKDDYYALFVCIPWMCVLCVRTQTKGEDFFNILYEFVLLFALLSLKFDLNCCSF